MNLAPYSKAITAVLVAIISQLLIVLPADGGFGDLTLVQWLGIALAVLGGGGGVYAVRNKNYTGRHRAEQQ